MKRVHLCVEAIEKDTTVNTVVEEAAESSEGDFSGEKSSDAPAYFLNYVPRAEFPMVFF